MLRCHSETKKLISASFVDGTSSAYADPLKIGAGTEPWALTSNGLEPENYDDNETCVAFGAKNSRTGGMGGTLFKTSVKNNLIIILRRKIYADICGPETCGQIEIFIFYKQMINLIFLSKIKRKI